jgi:hypothetical protein
MADELPTKCQVTGVDNADTAGQIKDFIDKNCAGLIEANECVRDSSLLAGTQIANLIELLKDENLEGVYLGAEVSGRRPIDVLTSAYNKEVRDGGGSSAGQPNDIIKVFESIHRAITSFKYDPEADLDSEKQSANSIYSSLEKIDPFLQALKKAGKEDAFIVKKALSENPQSITIDDFEYNPENSIFITIEMLFVLIKPNLDKLTNCAKQIGTFFVEYEDELNNLTGVAVARGSTTIAGQVASALPSEDNAKAAANLSQDLAETANASGKSISFASSGFPQFNDSCFLLSNIVSLAKFKKNMNPVRLPYVDSLDSNLMPICDLKNADHPPESFYRNSNSPIPMDGESFAFINDLTKAEHFSEMFNLTTDKISALVPSVRLYKVITDSEGKDVDNIEIQFDANPSVESYKDGDKNVSALDLFNNGSKRGMGVGLKNFTFEFRGSDPFSIKKDIRATLGIHTTSFNDLIIERKGKGMTSGKEARYSFAELALKTGKTPEEFRKKLPTIQQENLDKLNFRLKAVVGWAVPMKTSLSFTKSEFDAIRDSYIVLNLTPVTHEFNFGEQGQVDFNIQFYAYITDYFNNPTFNIFSDFQIESNRIGRKLLYNFLNKVNCDSEELSQIKKSDSTVIAAEKVSSFKTIISSLKSRKKLYFYNLTVDQISEFVRNGFIKNAPTPSQTKDNSVDKINEYFETIVGSTEGISEEDKKNLKFSLSAATSQRGEVSFFFLTDLLDVIMDNIDRTLDKISTQLPKDKQFLNYFDSISNQGYDISGGLKQDFGVYLEDGTLGLAKKEFLRLKKSKEQFSKLRIILGPTEIVDPFDSSKVVFCSLGDIPISLNFFVDFMSSKVLSSEEVYYPINNFIKDITSELLRNFLNNDSCFAFQNKQKVRIYSSVITAFNKEKNDGSNVDQITKYMLPSGNRINAKTFPIKPLLNVSGPSRSPVVLTENNREYNYFIFYAGRSYPVDKMRGNEAEDNKRGIFHYIQGKDRGIVQTINLQKTDLPGLKELRFEKEGFDGLTQLREVYNASVTCFLNVQTFPGTYIYVDPKGFIPEYQKPQDFTQFGIGGYYMVTRSEHTIEAGNAQSIITSKWVADTNGVAKNEEGSGKVDRKPDKQVKCAVKTQARKEQANATSNPETNAVDNINKRSGGTGHTHGSAGKA